MSTYNKEPQIAITGHADAVWRGYADIAEQLKKRIEGRTKTVIVIECYPAVRMDEIVAGLRGLEPGLVIYSESLAVSEEQREGMLSKFLTDDRVFGYMAPLVIEEFYDGAKVQEARRAIEEADSGVVLVIGFGASVVSRGDLLIYADLARWEIQQRYRSREFGNWLIDNHDEDILRKYKRGFFVEWRMADRLKRIALPEADYYLDTNAKDDPKLVTGEALFDGLKQTAARPFRLVPYFDPGVWGGTWLEKNIGLEPAKHPYAWGFDGVPEENSLYFVYGDVRVELPSINLVFFQPKQLLGERVYARFGADFPIRFDFLDTIGGQPLSLQVHPSTDYIQQQFGMRYTQDESYYMLDCKPDATVYLGLRENIDPGAMIDDLKSAADGTISFPADKYINRYPAKKHDHFLIPAGTVHCSGTGGMVLEISATPYIFTFKLWDWDRLGLDGKPRPVHLEHGERNIAWDRTTEWVDRNLVNRVERLEEGEGWVAEKTGLHEFEFIETQRHWFTGRAPHSTGGGVQMLNLVEGEEAVVESPHGAFEPFVIRYAETFIVPAAVGEYTIRPTERSAGQRLATIKAFVKS